MAARKNPSGGWKHDKLFRDQLNVVLKEIVEDDSEHRGKRKLRVLAEQLVNKGMSGDVAALKEIADRTDGKASQEVNVGGSLMAAIVDIVQGLDDAADESPQALEDMAPESDRLH